jgi:hypothetical protein
MAKKLPLGFQDFGKIIGGDFKYIDKTEYVYKIASKSGVYFLSRPRRFGKSLTLSTLNELYSGRQELFKGLWIEDKWDWGRKHPVLRISFTSIGYQTLGLERALDQELSQLATLFGVTLSTEGVAARFRELIQQLSAQHKVVVLIDEYDAPILNYLGKDIETAYQNRDLLRGFYAVLKDADPYLEFVFLTGVSKFSKVGIFSGLNNLFDLSMHPEYATMMGYTQAELENNFAEEIDLTAKALQLSTTELLDKIRHWYNGYRFEENAETVYNPVSTNTFFATQKFENYWFATGTPTFLINMLKQEGLYDFKLEPQSLQQFDSFDLEDLKAYGLLYQTGYLTIQSRDEYGLYTLDYPNHEVEDSMLAYLLEAYGGVYKGSGLNMAVKLEKAFIAGELEQVFRILQGLFKSVPYFMHERYPEQFFHAAIHLLFTYMGLRVHSEVHTSDGRVDAVVETDTRVYILEFKLDRSAEETLAQIRTKKYYQAWWHLGKPVVGIGVNFSSETKNVEALKAEEMG